MLHTHAQTITYLHNNSYAHTSTYTMKRNIQNAAVMSLNAAPVSVWIPTGDVTESSIALTVAMRSTVVRYFIHLNRH